MGDVLKGGNRCPTVHGHSPFLRRAHGYPRHRRRRPPTRNLPPNIIPLLPLPPTPYREHILQLRPRPRSRTASSSPSCKAYHQRLRVDQRSRRVHAHFFIRPSKVAHISVFRPGQWLRVCISAAPHAIRADAPSPPSPVGQFRLVSDAKSRYKSLLSHRPQSSSRRAHLLSLVPVQRILFPKSISVTLLVSVYLSLLGLFLSRCVDAANNTLYISSILVVIIFCLSRALLLHFLRVSVLHSAPETIYVSLSKIRQQQFQPILCLPLQQSKIII